MAWPAAGREVNNARVRATALRPSDRLLRRGPLNCRCGGLSMILFLVSGVQIGYDSRSFSSVRTDNLSIVPPVVPRRACFPGFQLRKGFHGAYLSSCDFLPGSGRDCRQGEYAIIAYLNGQNEELTRAGGRGEENMYLSVQLSCYPLKEDYKQPIWDLIARLEQSGLEVYPGRMSTETVTWTVESGAISLVSSSGNTATFQFSSSFNGGSIKAHGTNGSVECSDIKSFSSTPSVSCPQQSCLNVFEVEPCLDFQAVLGCANDVASVDWEYSIGPYSHVSFGTTTNPNGNYSMTKPLYLPSGSWDNYYLWVFADITLSDNSTCSLSKRILLSCTSGGGGNQ